MNNDIFQEMLQATKQERLRIEDVRNRSRYFIFGKIHETFGEHGYSVTFENVADRVIRDALWAKGRDSLFSIGDFFIPGKMDMTNQGVRIQFSMQELQKQNINPNFIKKIADAGFEYLMDSRDLIDYLYNFLDKRKDKDNKFIDILVGQSKKNEMRSAGNQVDCTELNDSQKNAIDKALQNRVTFLWGPAGTGKTKTMAALAVNLLNMGRRVLLTALSNVALDQLLLTTVAMLKENKLDTQIARLGTQMDEDCYIFSKKMFTDKETMTWPERKKWYEYVRSSSLIGANFTMLTYPYMPKTGKVDYVIADEVSMVHIPYITVASCFAKKGIVVGGDPFQLPPIYPHDAEEPNIYFRDNIFRIAGITKRDDPRTAFLDTQYRMQPQIGNLVSEMFYDGVLKTGDIPVSSYHGFPERVVFIETHGKVENAGEIYIPAEEQRRFNNAHAETVAEAVAVCLKHGVPPEKIGVIAPYNAQVVKILQKLRRHPDLHHFNTHKIKVSTIHSFQGQERQVIIADFTDDEISPTFLTAKRELINVALSRAKDQLIIVGNSRYLQDEKYFQPDEIGMFQSMLKNVSFTKQVGS